MDHYTRAIEYERMREAFPTEQLTLDYEHEKVELERERELISHELIERLLYYIAENCEARASTNTFCRENGISVGQIRDFLFDITRDVDVLWVNLDGGLFAFLLLYARGKFDVFTDRSGVNCSHVRMVAPSIRFSQPPCKPLITSFHPSFIVNTVIVLLASSRKINEFNEHYEGTRKLVARVAKALGAQTYGGYMRTNYFIDICVYLSGGKVIYRECRPFSGSMMCLCNA